MELQGRRFDTGDWVKVTIEDGVIGRVTPVAAPQDATAQQRWLTPGFVDIQVNGYGGCEFSSPELHSEAVCKVADILATFGVTHFCPTVTTNRHEVLIHAMKTLADACEAEADVEQRMLGIHLEGPYICSEDGPRGAHPAEHCRAPDLDEFLRLQDAADGRIALITLSPEYANAPEFIAALTARDVVVAIGHTSANSDQIRAAVDAGAQLSTHLGNGTHRTLRRHPNYLWDQLGEDRLCATLIADGWHLPPTVVKSMVRAKTPGRCILISDLAGQAGQKPGRHPSYGGAEVEILPDGRLVVPGQTQLLAGAAAPIGVGIANVMHFAGVDFGTAVAMATLNPLQLIGGGVNRFLPGDRADVVLLDLIPAQECNSPATLKVLQTLVAGEVAYSAL